MPEKKVNNQPVKKETIKPIDPIVVRTTVLGAEIIKQTLEDLNKAIKI